MSKGGPAYWVGNHRRSMESAGYPKTSTINLVCWGRDIPRGNSRIFFWIMGITELSKMGKSKPNFIRVKNKVSQTNPLSYATASSRDLEGPVALKCYISDSLSVCLSACQRVCLLINQNSASRIYFSQQTPDKVLASSTVSNFHLFSFY